MTQAVIETPDGHTEGRTSISKYIVNHYFTSKMAAFVCDGTLLNCGGLLGVFYQSCERPYLPAPTEFA